MAYFEKTVLLAKAHLHMVKAVAVMNYINIDGEHHHCCYHKRYILDIKNRNGYLGQWKVKNAS